MLFSILSILPLLATPAWSAMQSIVNSYRSAGGMTGSAPAYSGAPSDTSSGDPYPGFVSQYERKYTGPTYSGPVAMSHGRSQNDFAGSPIKSKPHFEQLFDDFPGAKTKQRIYYPGKGYVYMQVPVQQPDPYSKGSSSYSSGAYQDDSKSSYAPGPSYDSYTAPAPYGGGDSYSRQAPYAPAAPSDPHHEDDDSPFSYIAQRNRGSSSGYHASPSQQSPAPYKPPSYQPAPPAYKPTPPSYQAGSQGQYGGNPDRSYYSYNDKMGQPYIAPLNPLVSIVSGGNSYSGGSNGGYGGSNYGGGGNDDSYGGGVGLKSYNPPAPSNPSGYKPSGAYPSSYPDSGSSASTYSQTAADSSAGYQTNQAAPFDGPSARSYGPRAYSQQGRSLNGQDSHGRDFYDLAERDLTSGPGPYSR